METKERFKKRLRELESISAIQGGLSDYGDGEYNTMKKYENLILSGVGISELKEEIYLLYNNGKRYMHKNDFQKLIDNGTYIEV